MFTAKALLGLLLCCLSQDSRGLGAASAALSSQLSLGTGHLYPHLVGGKPCKFEGKLFKSGEKIARRHACHNCLCVRGNVECFWQDCPPPPEGCTEMTYTGICNPSMYECPIPGRNQTVMTARAMRYSGRFGSRRSEQGPVRGDCVIRGIAYFTGETIGVATNNCLECRCARNSMYCTPLCCFEKTSAREDDAERRFRSSGGRRPVDPNPLAHIGEDLGVKPSGSI